MYSLFKSFQFTGSLDCIDERLKSLETCKPPTFLLFSEADLFSFAACEAFSRDPKWKQKEEQLFLGCLLEFPTNELLELATDVNWDQPEEVDVIDVPYLWSNEPLPNGKTLASSQSVSKLTGTLTITDWKKANVRCTDNTRVSLFALYMQSVFRRWIQSRDFRSRKQPNNDDMTLSIPLLENAIEIHDRVNPQKKTLPPCMVDIEDQINAQWRLPDSSELEAYMHFQSSHRGKQAAKRHLLQVLKPVWDQYKTEDLSSFLDTVLNSFVTENITCGYIKTLCKTCPFAAKNVTRDQIRTLMRRYCAVSKFAEDIILDKLMAIPAYQTGYRCGYFRDGTRGYADKKQDYFVNTPNSFVKSRE